MKKHFLFLPFSLVAVALGAGVFSHTKPAAGQSAPEGPPRHPTGEYYLDDYVCPGAEGCAPGEDDGGDYAKAIHRIEQQECGASCTIKVGHGTYPLKSTVKLCRAVRIEGCGSGSAISHCSRFAPVAGITAFKFAFDEECDEVMPGGTGYEATLTNIGIVAPNQQLGSSSQNTSAILMEAPGTVDHVNIRGTFTHGVEISADATRSCPNGGCGDGQWHSGANLWHLSDVNVFYTNAEGIYVHGGDTNAGLAERVSVVHFCRNPADPTTCAGIKDDSFLGNTWIAPHVATSPTPGVDAYSCGNINARSVFIGAYAEEDLGISALCKNGVRVGGKSAWSGGTTIGEKHIGGQVTITAPTIESATLDRGATTKLMSWVVPGSGLDYDVYYDGVQFRSDGVTPNQHFGKLRFLHKNASSLEALWMSGPEYSQGAGKSGL